MVDYQAVKKALENISPGRFASGHLIYSQNMAALLRSMNMKSILILRDPRDVVVSHAFYIAKSPEHHLYSHFQGRKEEESISLSITGFKQNGSFLNDIDTRYRAVLPRQQKRTI